MILLQFFKFGVAGLLATATHVAVVMLLVEGSGLDPVLASLPAFIAALLMSYLINRQWTFDVDDSHQRSFPKYAIVATAGVCLNVAIMWICTRLLGYSYLVGLVWVIAIVPVLSFAFHRNWSFMRQVQSQRKEV